MKHSRQILSAFALVALVGAGCDPNRMMTGSSLQSAGDGTQIASVQGFGKLPGFNATGQLGSEAARSSVQNMASSYMAPPGTPSPVAANIAVAEDAAVGSGGGTSGKMMIMPAPDYKPVPVEYAVNATLPTWDTSGDVLKVRNELPDTSSARMLAIAAGLPSQAFGSNATVGSINVQWTSNEIQWTFEAANRYLSFWKNVPYEQPSNTKPEYDAEEVKRIADAFLDAHGFSSIRETGGEVDDTQYQIMLKESEKQTAGSMPCPMVRAFDAAISATPEAAPTKEAETRIAVDPAMPNAMIYPSPCNWWPQQVSVYYNTKRDGLPVVEIGGWPNRANSITVDLRTKQVTNGVLQMDQRLDRSSYPLIDAETAMKKLMAGGTNPVYSWGSETQNVKATIDRVELVWMRYDSWANNTHETFYLPAIVGHGTVNRGIAGVQPEEYHTAVPLVADSSFQEPLSPPPSMPLMQAEPAVAPTTPVTTPPADLKAR